MTIHCLIVVGVSVGNEWPYYVNQVIKLGGVTVVVSKHKGLWGHFEAILVVAHGRWGDRGTGGASGWLGKLPKTVGKAARKFTVAGKRTVKVDRWRGFGRVFEALACSIKKKYELNFIVNIVNFQLHKK